MTDSSKFKWVGARPVRPDGVDKVTGRAQYGADFALPGMLWGAILRSPHAHARITRIDAKRALDLEGVHAVVTAEDFPEIASEAAFIGEGQTNYRHLSMNVIARDKALYAGHPIAAVAATSRAVAEQAIALIDVEYALLPPVLDIPSALADDAPLLHEDLFTQGLEETPSAPSNLASRCEVGIGDPDAAFAGAELVIEREFETQPVHQGYIEPHACLAQAGADGRVTIHCSSQGHFMVRAYTAKLLGVDLSQIRVIPSEIGGGFGGKTTVYLEPLAAALSRKAGRPVKIVMSRGDVFRATGPAPATRIRVKIGARRDGQLVAADATLHYEAGAFPGSPVQAGAMTMFAPYALEHVRAVGYDVVVTKPKVAAYRAPGAPMAAFAVETIIDEIAEALEIDPVDLRLRNAAKMGTQAPFGPRFKAIGCVETLEAVKAHPHYSAPLGPNQGRGVAAGFWFNGGMQSTAGVNVNEDGTLSVISGNPDIGGSRASLAMMAAEELGIDYARVSPIVADTNSVGFSDLTGGSRVTFATGMAVVDAARDVVRQLRERAAALFEVEVGAIEWRDGAAHVVGDPAARSADLLELATRAARMGGPISSNVSLNARGVGVAFGAHICDVEVDPETGRVEIIRYTAVQDVGRAIHPSYVEGQLQGGAAQGIGWALNEEYRFDAEGRLLNPGFLDYRIPVASDLPMLDTVLVEVDNPSHPYGVRGVGEVPIVPPIPAVANAVYAATGVRFRTLPMSPPRVLAGILAGA